MGKPGIDEARLRVVQELRTMIAKVVLFNEQVNTLMGLNSSEAQTLHLIQLQGPISPTQLADATGLNTGTVTGVVDTLVARGLVKREPHPTDRRRVVVSVADGGLEALAEESGDVFREQVAHLNEAMAALTIAQLTVVGDFISRLNEAPAQIPEEFRDRLRRRKS